MVRRTACALRLFFPLLLGFSGGTVLWGLGRFAAPHLPHARGRQYDSGLSSAKPDSHPTGALPVPAGHVDEPFRGPVGGGLTGGGYNWRMKLPVDLQETIPDSAALPEMVLRLPHNAIQEVATGRRWKRVGNDWLEMEKAADQGVGRGDADRAAQERQDKWIRTEQERGRSATTPSPAADSVPLQKERLVLKRTKATAKGSKMYKLCSTAAAGGKLAATCLGWGLPIAPAAPTAPPPTPDPNDPFADIEDAVEDVGER